MKFILTTLLFFICFLTLSGQSVIIDGYTYESGNRGFIANAKVIIKSEDKMLTSAIADKEGHFVATVPEKNRYTLNITSDLYEDLKLSIDRNSIDGENKVFVKAEMERRPGYLFELTIAEERTSDDAVVDAISNTRIDVFNNTKFEELQVLEDYQEPQISIPLYKDNHYTILIRKEGYIAKRIEAFVDIEGCILCFEGLGKVSPGVTDNLSRNNQIGVLLANVRLEKAFSGKTIVLKDLYYAFGKAYLTDKARGELNKLIRMMSDNPEIKVELGSHTDSRGSAEKNRILSEKRAEAAVQYLIRKGIDEDRIISFGYGEEQLRNECKDGVYCSEREHAYNRRTEIKIIDIVKTEEAIKSLKQMKMMERAEKEMEEFAFGGQVKIGDTLNEPNLEIITDSLSNIVASLDDHTLANDNLDTVISDKIYRPSHIIYKIVILESEVAIPKDDELYSTFNDLQGLSMDSGYKYLIGSFTALNDVLDYYNNIIKKKYPEAKIVKYADGKIID